jgi:LmbE family N-acetylglucosaminyl deacetylase
MTSINEKVSETQSLLAVFAHPDDELFIAPILSRYAREGVDCHLAVVTDGRFGITDHMNGLAGDGLAALRRQEMYQSTGELGINDPIMLDFEDGFSHKTADLKTCLRQISALVKRIQQLLADLQPTVLITFGPEGIYAHPDHTTVSNVVTIAYQQQKSAAPCQLYYPGFSSQNLAAIVEDDDSILSRGIYPLDEEHLPVRVAFTEQDAEAARRSLHCHKSQFTPEVMDGMLKQLHRDHQISFRPWNGKFNSHESLF